METDFIIPFRLEPKINRGWGIIAGIIFLGALFPGSGEAVFFSKKDRGRHGPTILQLGAGVRSAGMANAYVGLANDASALYWNPSGADRAPTQELLVMRGDSFGGKTQNFLGYLCPFWAKGERRTLGVSLSRQTIDPFDLVEEGQPAGRVKPSENVLGVSYAQPLGPLLLGMTLKAIDQQLDEKKSHTWATDFGVSGAALKERLTWGASVLHVGPAMNVDGVNVPLPLTLMGGAAYRMIGQERSPRSGQVILSVQGDAPNDDVAVARLGIEYSNQIFSGGRVAVRGGWASRGVGSDSGQWFLGGGVGAGPLNINFAQLIQGPLGDETRVDVSVRFGHELGAEVKRRQRLFAGEEALSQGNLLAAQNAVDAVLAESPRSHSALQLARRIRVSYSETIDPPTLFTQGRKAYDLGMWGEAAGYFQKLLVVSPQYPDAKMWLGKAEDQAEKEKLKQIEDTVRRARRNKLEGLRGKAEQSMRNRDWQTALTFWRKVLALEGDHALAKKGVSVCRENILRDGDDLKKQGDLAGALTVYKYLMEDDSHDNELTRRLFRVEQDQRRQAEVEGNKRYDEGIDAFTKGDYGRAQTLFQQAMELRPKDERVRKALDRVQFEIKQKKQP